MKRVYEHIIFWTLYWLLVSLSGGLYDLDFGRIFLYNLFYMPLIVLPTYLFVYGIIPLYFRKKIVLMVVSGLLAMVVTLLLRRVFTQYVQFPLLYGDTDYTFTFFNWYRIVGDLVRLFAMTGMVAGFKYYRDWKRTREKVEELSKEKREAELRFLNAQIHPHFLFNTLNSIYYEAVKKTDLAPDLIIQLSEMLRFTLYECRGKFISVSKEVELIRSYVKLEQSRYGSRLIVRFEVVGETNGAIPPMICFSLVENAFKHGASESQGESSIDIEMRIEAGRLSLTVKNPDSKPEQADVLGASKGIGLKNITRQLDLVFENDYHLGNERINDTYVSRLDIPLN